MRSALGARNPQLAKSRGFVGSRAANQLPALLTEATKRGPVLAMANTMAVIAAFGPGQGSVVVADIDANNIAGIQDIAQMAEREPDQGKWLNAVRQKYDDPGNQLGLLLQQPGVASGYEHFRRRIQEGRLSFFNLDLSGANVSELKNEAPEGFAAVYTGNIEHYIGGFMATGAIETPEREASMGRYRTNLLSV